jgi:hypothetical protein
MSFIWGSREDDTLAFTVLDVSQECQPLEIFNFRFLLVLLILYSLALIRDTCF